MYIWKDEIFKKRKIAMYILYVFAYRFTPPPPKKKKKKKKRKEKRKRIAKISNNITVNIL